MRALVHAGEAVLEEHDSVLERRRTYRLTCGWCEDKTHRSCEHPRPRSWPAPAVTVDLHEYDCGAVLVLDACDPRAAVSALFKAHAADRSLEAFVAAARELGFEVEEMWRRRR